MIVDQRQPMLPPHHHVRWRRAMLPIGLRAVVLGAAAALSACSVNPGNPALSPLEVRKRIAALLFRIPLADIDKDAVGANYDYNNFGEDAEAAATCTGYAGGHAGTDMQTKDVEGAATADRGVYALTAGEVLSTDVATGRAFIKSTMLVEDVSAEVKLGYLHLRSIAVNPGDRVAMGAGIGVQGNLGLGLAKTDTTTREHVHVEIRAGSAPTGAACGASPKDEMGNAKFGALDPQKYFAAIVEGAASK